MNATPTTPRTHELSLRDRRTGPRRVCSLEVSCQPISGKGCDLWWLAEIKDFCAGGVGMLSTRHFERGAFVAIQFFDLLSGQGKTRTAQVMRVDERPGGWFLGCSFRTPLDDDELAALTHTAGR